MGLDAGGIDLFEEVDGHAQVHVAHAVDGQAHGVLAGIENAVLAGAVIFELQQIVAVFQGIDVLRFASVDELHFRYLREAMVGEKFCFGPAGPVRIKKCPVCI